MDLKQYLLDIDELISQFVECESTTFTEFKRVWLSKKFSFIFESMPSTNLGFLMQSLYAHCLGYIISAGSLSNKLGGLYCLYCLYETQPFKPSLKIYLSLGVLRQLRNFVIDAKQSHQHVVNALMKHMLEKNVFLFGFVGEDEGSATERVNELVDLQNKQVQTAYNKLFANSRLEHIINMDMGVDLDIELMKKRSLEYAAAKQLAIKEASQVIDVENTKHIAENKQLIGDIVEKTAADWNKQKELFYKQTGFVAMPVMSVTPDGANQRVDGQKLLTNSEHNESSDVISGGSQVNNEEEYCDENKDDEFERELEEALLFQPLECEDEEFENGDNWEGEAYFDG